MYNCQEWWCQHHAVVLVLHKVDGEMEKVYLHIIQRHLNSTNGELKLGNKWLCQQNSDPKIRTGQ